MQTQQKLWKKKLLGWQLVAKADKLRPGLATMAADISTLFLAARAIPIHRSEQQDLLAVRNRWIQIKRGQEKE